MTMNSLQQSSAPGEIPGRLSPLPCPACVVVLDVEPKGFEPTVMEGSSADGGRAPFELHGRLSVDREVKWWPSASLNFKTCTMTTIQIRLD